MRIMKFEVDIPEFDKEINISITIKKDGEVVTKTTSPLSNTKKNLLEKPIGDDVKGFEIPEETTKTKEPKKKASIGSSKGNLMNVDF